MTASNNNNNNNNNTNISISQTLERINRDTRWDSLSQEQVSSVLIRMEDATVNFYESATWNHKEHAAIQKFWDSEWGCTYDWTKREWRCTASGKRFESEGEKRAKRVWEERVQEQEQDQDQHQDQSVATWSGVDWISAHDSYHDYGWYDANSKNKNESEPAATATAATATATATAAAATAAAASTTNCQTVLYIEEHSGDPGWRMFIHYNANSNRYIINGTRRVSSVPRTASTIYPDIRLAFRYRSDVLDYLAWCMNTRPTCDMMMYAMHSDIVPALSVDKLHTYRKKTELYGYIGIQLRTADLREQLAVLRGLDTTYSNFDDIDREEVIRNSQFV